MTKAAELRVLNEDELLSRLAEHKQELFKMRFDTVTGQLQNISRITQVRRDVARINGILREREIEAAAVGRGLFGDRIDRNKSEIFDAARDFRRRGGGDRAADKLTALGERLIAIARHALTAPSSRGAPRPPRSRPRGIWQPHRRSS